MRSARSGQVSVGSGELLQQGCFRGLAGRASMERGIGRFRRQQGVDGSGDAVQPAEQHDLAVEVVGLDVAGTPLEALPARAAFPPLTFDRAQAHQVAAPLPVVMSLGAARSPVPLLEIPNGPITLTMAESPLLTGTNRTLEPGRPLPRRSASRTVGPTVSAKLHEVNARLDSVNVTCCATRATTVSAHFAPARQKSDVAMSVSGPLVFAM